MNIFEGVSLKPFNTFGIDVKTDLFVDLNSILDIQYFCSLTQYKGLKKLILGGGSNILFTEDFRGATLKINNKGILKSGEDKNYVYLNVQAGETWEDFVNYCLQNNFGGLENLVLIPGNVGSCPIQNIGAYGAEVKDCIESVEILDTESLQMTELSNAECKFGYRDSVFKNELKNRVIIVSVNFKLNRDPSPKLNYEALNNKLAEMQVSDPGILDIAAAVSSIRRAKLPDPKDIGNAGSFFKNPVVDNDFYLALKKKHCDLPSFPCTENHVKLPAAWFIEKTGFKGYRKGEAGVHHIQPLVLINHGHATGNEILELARLIRHTVSERFDIILEMEVNLH